LICTLFYFLKSHFILQVNGKPFKLLNRQLNLNNTLVNQTINENSIPPTRRPCRIPIFGHKLCPDGYQCDNFLKCKCECPNYAPSKCCPPSKQILPKTKPLKKISFNLLKNTSSPKLGNTSANKMINGNSIPPTRRPCRIPIFGHKLCPDGYKCDNFLKCKCECPNYAPSKCCPPSKQILPKTKSSKKL
uniref:Uncharacterized protein n=1 Tax=Clytia hemisphaerica TaxID=252671 RepID=A0A7M5WTX2_9CNID